MRKLIMIGIALCLSATSWAQEAPDAVANDLNLKLTKVDSGKVMVDAWSAPNGLSTHRLVFIGPEAVPSMRVVPLGTTASYSGGTKPMGSFTLTAHGGGGIGGGKLDSPGTGHLLVNETEMVDGVLVRKTVTQNLDGTITMDMRPEANGVLADQQPAGDTVGKLGVTITENGGPNHGNFAGYSVFVPFMNVGSAVSVTHFYSSNTYAVTSFHVTIGGATLSCSGTSLKITIDWFKASKGT